MLAIIIAMIIWGSIGAVVLLSGLTPIEASFFRCLFGALFLLPYCAYKNVLTIKKYPLKQLFLVALGGIFITLNWVLLFQSFIWASITLGNVSYYLQPVFLVVLGIVFFKDRVTYQRWFYILLTMVGVLLTIDIAPNTVSMDSTKLLGIACALGAAILYAFATIIIKFIHDIPPSLVTLIQLGVGAVLLLPVVHFNQITFTSTLLFYMIILGVIHTAIAYILYYKGVKTVSITNIAIIGYVDPIVAIATDIAFFNNSLSILQITGITLTMVSSYFVIKLGKTAVTT